MTTLSSKPISYWALKVAIAHASNDPREAPWYGPWNIVLQDLFFSFCPRAHYTATYPQFPLVKDIDVVDSEGESDKEMDQKVERYRRSTAPSPEAVRGYRPIRPPQTPPNTTILPRQRRSIRIPDFVQVCFKIKVDQPGDIVNNPLTYLACPLLLVEIKKTQPSCHFVDFFNVMAQTAQQARHAFASYPRLNVIGVVVALGDCWMYREYFRVDLSPSPTGSERFDPTFVDSNLDTEPQFNTSRTCDDVEIAIGPHRFARLQSPTSDNAFVAVRKRLKSLAPLMF